MSLVTRKPIVGVMGPSRPSAEITRLAFSLGGALAERGYAVLSGGRDVGVMDAVSRGAKQSGGLTIGVLPGEDTADASPWLDVPIVTGMGNARNVVNVLSSDVVVACGMGAGTASEVALALKSGRPVVLLRPSAASLELFRGLDDSVRVAGDVPETTAIVEELLGS